MSGSDLVVAVVGLGFGQDFVPIYLSHPSVAAVVLVEPDALRRADVAVRFGISVGYATLEEALADPQVDAVHILTPVHLHADMVVNALEAGKHVACAVPMATTLEDLDRILQASSASETNYMMMETAVYGREYLAANDLNKQGEFGAVTLYRGFHIQNLDGFPTYWQGYPPMHYVTHALSPILGLLDTTVESVHARGGGRLPDRRMTGGFQNPFPSEVGLFALRNSDVIADVTMSFFQTARSYIEGFAIYGEHLGLEWPIDNDGPLTVFRMTNPEPGGSGNRVETSRLSPVDRPDLLPDPLRGFVRESIVSLPDMPAPVAVGAHHGGSHPHLVHEFISSIVEDRSPFVDGPRAANWTAPGIVAHESALRGGETLEVHRY